jgi:opacity protein-like surface antigen
MDRCRHRAYMRAALAAACWLALLPAVASAQSTTDLTDWNLTESVSTWGGGTQFHHSTGGDGWAAFRWLDSPNKATVISSNGCTDLSLLGSSTYGVGDTGYHNLSPGVAGSCFVMRGRTTAGSGSMLNHDGRVKR